MHNKSQVVQIFTHFEALVDMQFNSKITQLQSDGGTYFKSMEPYLFLVELLEEFHVPTTLHKKVMERKKRHVVKTGFSLMVKGGFPLQY